MVAGFDDSAIVTNVYTAQGGRRQPAAGQPPGVGFGKPGHRPPGRRPFPWASVRNEFIDGFLSDGDHMRRRVRIHLRIRMRGKLARIDRAKH